MVAIKNDPDSWSLTADPRADEIRIRYRYRRRVRPSRGDAYQRDNA